MDQSYRLSDVGLINRDKKLSFKFNGKTYYGEETISTGITLFLSGDITNNFSPIIFFPSFNIAKENGLSCSTLQHEAEI